MAFSQPNALDVDHDRIRWSAQCTAADEIYMEVDTVVTFDNDPKKGSVAVATAAKDYVAKGVVGGLDPATVYFWRFFVNGVVQTPQTEPEGTGTTYVSIKTAPAPGTGTTLKIAVGGDLLEGDSLVWKTIAAMSPDLMVVNGDNIDIDAQVSSPPTSQADHWTAYNLLFDNSHFSEGRMQRHVGFRIPMKNNCDDHDYFSDYNVDDDPTLYEWGKFAFRSRWPVDEANLYEGTQRVEQFGKVDLFFLDSRRRNGNFANYARFPTGGADTHAIETTSTRTTLYIDDTGTGHVPVLTEDYYAGWYVRLSQAQYTRSTVRPPHSDLWRRVIASEQVQTDGNESMVKLTLNKALPSTFDPTVDKWLFMDNASVLDANDAPAPVQDGNQFDWLVDALNASTARWRIIVSPLVMNHTHVGADNWRKWSALNGEVRTLYQMLDDPLNIVVTTGDLHRHGLDDGTNGEWPEICSTPVDQGGSTGAVSTWSHGQADRPTTNPDATSNGFALLTVTDASIQIDYYWSNDGTPLAMGGITSLTHNYVTPPAEENTMQTKRITLSGVQTNAALVTPGSGESLKIRRIVATANTASDLIVSRGNVSDTTALIHEEGVLRVEREYERPGLILDPDEVLRFSGGVAAEDSTIVVEYASRV
jgi:hypothetical protein